MKYFKLLTCDVERLSKYCQFSLANENSPNLLFWKILICEWLFIDIGLYTGMILTLTYWNYCRARKFHSSYHTGKWFGVQDWLDFVII